MAGKKCMGNNDVPNNTILSTAYCEGRKFATGGGVVGYASGESGVEGDNNGITWTALVPGDNQRIDLIDLGYPNATLKIQPNGGSGQVFLATDGGGIISLASEVIDAINNHPIVGLNVEAANTGTSDGTAEVVAETVVLTGSDEPIMGIKEAEAFQRGFDSYHGGVGAVLPRDCCAEPAYDGVP